MTCGPCYAGILSRLGGAAYFSSLKAAPSARTRSRSSASPNPGGFTSRRSEDGGVPNKSGPATA